MSPHRVCETHRLAPRLKRHPLGGTPPIPGRSMRTLALTLLLAATGSSQSSGQDCGITLRSMVTDSGIGTLIIGTPVRVVQTECRVVRDTVVNNDDLVEMERVLYVDLGRDTVVVAVWNEKIDRIDIFRGVFRTPDSLFAGMPLRQLLRKRGVTAAASEASIQADVPGHCGLGVELSGGGPSKDEFEYTNDELRRWPPSITVRKLWIYRCRNGGH